MNETDKNRSDEGLKKVTRTRGMHRRRESKRAQGASRTAHENVLVRVIFFNKKKTQGKNRGNEKETIDKGNKHQPRHPVPK